MSLLQAFFTEEEFNEIIRKPSRQQSQLPGLITYLPRYVVLPVTPLEHIVV